MSTDRTGRPHERTGTPSPALAALLAPCGEPMSVDEVVEVLGAPRCFVVALIRSGALGRVALGDRVGVPKASLMALLSRSRQYRPAPCFALVPLHGLPALPLLLARRAS